MSSRNDIVIHPKYMPLFCAPKTRYVLVKGGRGSGKSFACSLALLTKQYEDGNDILYTRYTMTSAEDSIIPEYNEKLEMMGREAEFIVAKRSIICRATGGRILFRGIKTSSGVQTGKLKSIPNIKIWVIDEADELVDEEVFDTIDLSVRKKGADNVIYIIFNPPDVEHWIYRRFYAPNSVPEDFNGIIGDVTYISTSYLDNLPNLDEAFLARAEAVRLQDYERYCNVFLGHFAQRRQGLIYPNWEEISAEVYPNNLPEWYGIDWGYSNDPTAVARMCIDLFTKTIYVWEVLYKRELRTAEIIAAIKADAQARNIDATRVPVYADPARPEHIRELRFAGLSAATGAENAHKDTRVDFLRYFNVKFVGPNIKAEQTKYSFKPSKIKGEYTNEPQDGNDHLMDAINYGGVTHLRRLGITNTIGDK